MSSKLRLAAFDLGNVMVDVRESIPADRLATLSGRSQDQVFDALFSPAKKALFESGKVSWEEHAAKAIEMLGLPLTEPELRAIYRTSLVPDPAVLDIVADVAEQVPITIASNTSQPHWEWAQENLLFAGKFDPPILSHLIGAMKPDADFYRALIERSGLEPDDIFFTDDRRENIEGAQSLGIRSFLFTGADRLVEDLAGCGIDIGL